MIINDNNKMKQSRGGSKNYFATMYTKYGMFLILVALIILSASVSGSFLKPTNLSNILMNISTVAFVAFGMTFVLLLGRIDLSSGSVMALTGCITCIIVSTTGMLFWGIIAGILVGALCGIINGWVIAHFRIPAFIMTLAMMQIARGTVLLITSGRPVSGMGDAFKEIGGGHLFNIIPIPIILMIVFFVASWIILNRTKFGRYIYAVGGNEIAAKASGVKVNRTIIFAYLYMGLLTGIAGIVYMSRINSGQPAGATGYEFDAITAAVIGGTSLMGGIGSLFGTFVGCLIIGIINNIVNLVGIGSEWQEICKGIIIVIAVILDFKTKSAVRKAS